MFPPRTAFLPAISLLALFLLALASSPTAAAPFPARASATPQVDYAVSAVEATNAARSRSKLRELQTDKCLEVFAGRQARAMANRQKLFHQDLGAIMRTCRLDTAAENVAAGYGSGSEAVTGWLQSPGHRANILHRRFRMVAVAARADSDGRWYTAQVFGSSRP